MNKFKIHISLLIRTLIAIVLTLNSISADAQVFSAEQNPFRVKWRQIEASGFQLIYPTEMEDEAQRMANTISRIYPLVGSSLNRQKTRIPILLQNRGVIANGFVQLAPKKSEFYTTPPQQFDSQDWLNNLAVHELRHVAQFDKFTGNRKHPFPEEFYLAWFGVSLPMWFVEGDAVSTETSLTQSGRGRQPSWIMPYRASLLEGKKFSYSKAYFGSQKDVTPGYYQLGYLIASNIRRQEGRNIFDSILTDIKKRPLRIYPFSNSLKKFSGYGTHRWYKNTSEELKIAWTDQNKQIKTETYDAVNKSTSFATGYHNPVRLSDHQVLALKESKAEAAHFVLIDSSKRETKLKYIGYQEIPWFSYASDLIVWDEIRYDPRFRQRSYSTICSYDLKTKRIKKLSSRSRIFSPALSPDGKKIIAVQIDLSNRCNLIEMNASDGKIIKTYDNPQNLILQMPSYDRSGTNFTYISVTEEGKSLWTGQQNGQTKKLISESRQQLGRPVFLGSQIAFNAHYNGIDNIYAIDTASGKISALTAAKYGAFNLSPSSTPGAMMFNDYQLSGYQAAETSLNPKPVEANHFVYFGKEAELQENTGNVFEDIPDSSYTSKRYGRLSSLINIHSLSPVSDSEYSKGLQLLSANLLNTFTAHAGANYRSDLDRFDYHAGFNIKSFYPIFSGTYRNLPRRTFYKRNNIMQQGDWRENYFSIGALLPVNLNTLNHNYSFSLNLATSYTKRYQPENLPRNFITTIRFPLEYRFSLSHALRTADRDIAPRWAQTFRFTYYNQPFDKQLEGELFAAEGYFYFPGIAKNHTFLANFNYQKATGVRSLNTEIATVYGYNNIKALSPLSNTLLLNYRFPFAFPDTELGPLAYIRNLRATLFCHYENIGTETNMGEPKTYGFELRSSMNLLRYQPIVDLGARFVFVNKIYDQKPILELILNYSF
jgi:hypothetical protein